MFTTVNEFADGSYYNPGRHPGAEENGNIEIGDGPRYKGRGFMQLTWFCTYQDYFTYISYNYPRYRNRKSYNDLTLENHLLSILQKTQNNATRTDLTQSQIYSILIDKQNDFSSLLSKSMFFASDSAGWFWSNSKYSESKDYPELKGLYLNEISENKDRYLDWICVLVNGGGNGKTERKNYYAILKNLLKNDFLCDL